MISFINFQIVLRFILYFHLFIMIMYTFFATNFILLNLFQSVTLDVFSRIAFGSLKSKLVQLTQSVHTVTKPL